MSGSFTIGGWVSPPPAFCGRPDFVSERSYRLAAECGMDLLFHNYEKDGDADVFRALAAAEKAGVGCMVNDRRFLSGDFTLAMRRNAAARYARFRSFRGVNLRDEPRVEELPLLGLEIERNRAFLPAQFVNLLPLYAPGSALSPSGGTGEGTEENYADYLAAFAASARPSVLSYDFYPFRWEFGKCDARFFTQMSMARSAAERLKLDVWDFIQVTSWDRACIRNLEKAEIFWQVSVSLACGVRGIHYFCFWTPTDGGGETFLPALIGPDGEPTKWYGYVREINRQARPAGELLARAEYLGLLGESGLAPVPDVLRPREETLPFDLPPRALCGVFAGESGMIYCLVNDSLRRPLSVRTLRGKTVEIEPGGFAIVTA